MIPPDVLAQIEVVLQDVARNGFGNVLITFHEGEVSQVEPKYSYKFVKGLTDLNKFAIFKVIE
jgi:hypothetical protein